jgi:sec-independent protein translocase protein TatA
MLNGIGPTGIILLVVIALLLFGPNKLPELGRAFGRTLREFKAGARDVLDDSEDRKSKERVEINKADDVQVDNKRLPD